MVGADRCRDKEDRIAADRAVLDEKFREDLSTVRAAPAQRHESAVPEMTVLIPRIMKDRRAGDLPGRGSVQQHADVVAFLFREEMYKDDPDLEGRAELIVAKNRNGSTGTARLNFLSKSLRFENLAPEDEWNMEEWN